MTKKKEICQYELLCLLNDKENKQEKYDRMIKDMEKLIGKENILKIEEKPWKPVYQISGLINGGYLLIILRLVRTKAKELEKEILNISPKDFLNRYFLLNLEDEPRNKTKLNKLKNEDAQQN